MDTEDLIRHYQSDALPHDVKGPANYGNYQRKERVVLHDRTARKRAATARNTAPKPEDTDEDDGEAEEEEDDDAETSSNLAVTTAPAKNGHTTARTDPEPDSGPAHFAKRAKINSSNLRFNPLQQQVQRQFHNLYAVASQPDSTTSLNPHLSLIHI